MPWDLLYRALSVTAAAVIADDKRLTLIGYALTQRGWYVCTDGCEEGRQGSYTVISDVEHIEHLANGCMLPGRPLQMRAADGRSALVVPGNDETVVPW